MYEECLEGVSTGLGRDKKKKTRKDEVDNRSILGGGKGHHYLQRGK
jgi:hypothetical protein